MNKVFSRAEGLCLQLPGGECFFFSRHGRGEQHDTPTWMFFVPPRLIDRVAALSLLVRATKERDEMLNLFFLFRRKAR